MGCAPRSGSGSAAAPGPDRVRRDGQGADRGRGEDTALSAAPARAGGGAGALLSRGPRGAAAASCRRAIGWWPSRRRSARRSFVRSCPPDVRLLPQVGADLGARMSRLLSDLLAEGYAGAIAVGTDTPTLPTAYLVEACEALRSGAADVVLGPSEDGGYYLIGLGAPAPELFVNVPWSTATVYAETLARARASGRRIVGPAELVRRRPRPGPRATRPRSGAGRLSPPTNPRLRGWTGAVTRRARCEAARLRRVRGRGGRLGRAVRRGGRRLFLDPAPGHGDDGPRRVELDRDLAGLGSPRPPPRRPPPPGSRWCAGSRWASGAARACPRGRASGRASGARAPGRRGRPGGTRRAAGNPGAPSPAR